MDFARVSGFRGARFPEASNDLGSENGPQYVLSYPDQKILREWSSKEVLHVSADICYALNQYWQVTGDDAYMECRGFRMVLECARFSASAFKWSDPKQAYELKSVMGPDEYHYHVNNSFFTNYMLRWCIRFALSLLERSGFPVVPDWEIKHWTSVANNVYLPWMLVQGVLIPEEFDGYASLREIKLRNRRRAGPRFADEAERKMAGSLQNFNSKLVKQADIVLLMSLFPEHFSAEVKRAAFGFYEPRTVHESSLSYGPHAVVAAHLGEADVCAAFILRASRYNLDFTPVTNYSNGLHLSAYAGAWQGLAQGLAGLNIKNGELNFKPQLPSDWDSYNFTIFYRGQRLKILISGQETLEVSVEGLKLETRNNQDSTISVRDELL